MAKNVGYQTVSVPNDFCCILCPYIESQWERKLISHQHSLKHILRATEREVMRMT